MGIYVAFLFSLLSCVCATNVVVFNGNPTALTNLRIGGVFVLSSISYRQTPVTSVITYTGANQQVQYVLNTEVNTSIANSVGAATGGFMLTYNGFSSYLEQAAPAAGKANLLLMVAANLGTLNLIHCYGRLNNDVTLLTANGAAEGAIIATSPDMNPGSMQIKCFSTKTDSNTNAWNRGGVLANVCVRFIAGQTVVVALSGNGQSDFRVHHNGVEGACAALGHQVGMLAAVLAALTVFLMLM